MIDGVCPVFPAAERMRRYRERRRRGRASTRPTTRPTGTSTSNATAACRPGAADLARRAPTPMRAGTAPAMLASMRRWKGKATRALPNMKANRDG